jgi:hypothetical protein
MNKTHFEKESVHNAQPLQRRFIDFLQALNSCEVKYILVGLYGLFTMTGWPGASIFGYNVLKRIMIKLPLPFVLLVCQLLI